LALVTKFSAIPFLGLTLAVKSQKFCRISFLRFVGFCCCWLRGASLWRA
jgi:hypothetical protein